MQLKPIYVLKRLQLFIFQFSRYGVIPRLLPLFSRRWQIAHTMVVIGVKASVRTGLQLHGMPEAVNVTSVSSLRGNIESDVNHTRFTGWAFGNQTKTAVRQEPCIPDNGVKLSR
jgi:hypothetical protein